VTDATKTAELEARIGYRFDDPALLDEALTHRSHAYERSAARGGDYERLEFLGDALLGFLVSDWLWHDDPTANEGDLSRRKQSVVRTEALAHAARRLGIGDALLVGRGEESTGGRNKPSLLADVFEAVLGAVYLDGGIRPARTFVRRHLGEALRAARFTREVAEDYKTRLQEQVQARLRQTPAYRIVSTSGPAHALQFLAEVLVAGEVVGEGTGSSRKQAEQEAARDALERLGGRGA
jgi:ribonuclease-3